MLAAIGEAPVSTLDTLSSDVEMARMKLHQVSCEIQSEGWTFNKDRSVRLLPNALDHNRIKLAPNVETVEGDGPDTYRRLAARGGYLYDRDNQTFVFQGGVTVATVISLPFDDVPTPVQTYILRVAVNEYQEEIVGSRTLAAFSEAQIEVAEARAKRYDVRQRRTNVVMSHVVRAIMNRRHKYRGVISWR